MTDWSAPSWANALRKLRDDVNALAWLFEEERTIQRLYLESAFWAMTGTRFTVDEFSAEVGFGSAHKGTTDDSEQSEAVALESGSSG